MRKLLAVSLLSILWLTPISLAQESDPQAPPAKSSPTICPLAVKPKGVKSLKSFSELAVLEDGRLKPLDTYARNLLLQFSGRQTLDKKSALRWFAEFIFVPEASLNEKIFLINNPEILASIGLEPHEKRRYSFNQLEPGYNKLHELAIKAHAIDAKKRSLVEEELVRVDANVQLFAELSHAFKFLLPHSDFTITHVPLKEMLDLDQEAESFSFLEIALRANLISLATEALEKKDSKNWTTTEAEVVRLMSNLYQWSSYYRNLPFHLVPAFDAPAERWLSPWDAIGQNFNQQAGRDEIVHLANLSAAFIAGHQLEFDMAARAFQNSIQQRADQPLLKQLALMPLEVIYNHLSLFSWAKWAFLLALLGSLIALLSSHPWLKKINYALVILGGCAMGAGILLRIIMLSRPPVSNLYETFIFVAFVSVLLSLVMERIQRQGVGILVGSICGYIFLSIAGKFAAEGDTLKMLVAVLNSNFWLSTHVLSITMGYSGVCVAGILGHVYVLQRLLRPKDVLLAESTYRHLLGILGFGLTMTFLGTNLGGIWADQSWGRFWGWDPKENGALLIVLWCAIIFHAKIAGLIGPIGVAIGSILGIIVTMWAWFGVNLLSVGLHSYGFTSGISTGLLIYVTVQLLFLFVTIPPLKKRSG